MRSAGTPHERMYKFSVSSLVTVEPVELSERNRPPDPAASASTAEPVEAGLVISSITSHTPVASLIELTGKCNGIGMSMLLDSGSTSMFISTQRVHHHHMKVQEVSTPWHVNVADGRQIECKQYVIARLHIGQLVDHVKLIVAPIEHDIVLGLPWMMKHHDKLHINYTSPYVVQYQLPSGDWCQLPVKGSPADSRARLCSLRTINKRIRSNDELYIVHVHANAVEAKVATHAPEVASLLNEYATVFPEQLPAGLPPSREIEHTIELEPDSKLPMVRPEYRKSGAELEWLHKEIQQGLAAGWIRPSRSPYAARVILVKKPNTNEYRVCVDYRDLNSITQKNNYGLPRQDELFDRVSNAQWFSKIDLRTGYYQIAVAEADRYKTAFKTRYGHYEYNVMPMGLCNAPATFMRLMHEVFDDMLDRFVVIYLDDILIYSKTREEHIQHLRQVLDRLRQHSLYAKLSKCEFLQSEVSFLGHIIGKDGVKMDPRKVSAIQQWPPPNNVHELKSFLGLAGYYRKFIANYSNISAPLTELTKKLTAYQWGAAEQSALEQLKEAVTSAPLLLNADPSKPYTVYTDASGYAVGAALMQDHGAGEQPIAYYSHKMNPAECKYPVYEQELLAVKHALLEWRHYLLGNHFVIYTDHQSLTWLKSQPNLSTRQARWLDLFTEYDYTIEYIKGQTNSVADALSRRIDLKSLSIASVTDDVLSRVRMAYANDPFAQSIINGTAKSLTAYTHDADTQLIYYDKRIYIPRRCTELIQSLLHEVHDGETAGHGGVHVTLEQLQRYVYWPKMKHTVQQYVRSCKVCQQDKPRTTLVNGLLVPHDVPERRWHTISMDYITALPDTSTGHNAILVVTDKLSKMSHFIPTNINVTAEQTVQLFIDNVFKLHGLPSKIISDRGPQFTAKYWTQLWRTLQTRLNISTAYHPQTDGQTERTNSTLQSILRHYVHWNEATWDRHLPLVEFAYNNHVHTATQYSPFYLMYGEHPQAPISMMFKDNTCIPVNTLLIELQTHLKQAQDNIRYATDSFTQRVNQSRNDITFKVGEKVLLSTKNLRVQSPDAANKFLPKYIGPFPVTEVVSSVAYRLELPETMLCHPVFHVDRLQPYVESDSTEFPGRVQANRPLPPVEAPEPELLVDRILDRCWREIGTENTKGYKAWREWLVRWQGHGAERDSWEKQHAFVSGTTTNTAFLEYERANKYQPEEIAWIRKYDKNKYVQRL